MLQEDMVLVSPVKAVRGRKRAAPASPPASAPASKKAIKIDTVSEVISPKPTRYSERLMPFVGFSCLYTVDNVVVDVAKDDEQQYIEL